MADSDSRGSEKPEGSESRLEGLDALFDKMAQKMAQDRKQDLSEFAQKVEQGFSEIRQEIKQEFKQEIGAVVVRMDLMREERVAARRRCEGSTEVVRPKQGGRRSSGSPIPCVRPAVVWRD